MPEGFDAGSIFVALRAQLDDFNKGIRSAKDSLAELAASATATEVVFTELDTSVQVFQELETKSARAVGALGRLGAETTKTAVATREATKATREAGIQTEETEKKVSRSALSFARATQRIISVQIALLALAQHGNGPVKDAFQAISNGVSVAAASMQLFGNRISFAGAGLIGLGVGAISLFTRYLEESIKATDKSSDAMERTRKSADALRNAIYDAETVTKIFGGTTADNLLTKLRLEEQAFATNTKRIREISDELRKLKGLQSDSHDAGRAGEIETLETERLRLNQQQDDLRKTAIFDKANAEIGALTQKTVELNEALFRTGVEGAQSLRFGVAEPAAVAGKDVQAATAYFNSLLDTNQQILHAAYDYNVSLEQREALLRKLVPYEKILAAAEDVKSKQAYQQRVNAVNDLARSFSTAFGDGLRDAILNAKKPMEALAAIGQNLFANMIDQTVKRLETGLTEAFKAITGAAGEGIGLAITGILGAAGAILSKLGSKGSDKYGAVQSSVTSSQAFRGIVAGPSSVAIATVSDDLARAVAPVVSRLDSVIGVLNRIDVNTRIRTGGIPSNVGVATA